MRHATTALVLLLAGCSCASTPTPADAAPDAIAYDDAFVDAAPIDAGRDAGPPAPISTLTFPQAVDGAMWASPEIYPSLPLHVVVDGDATAVHVMVGTHAVDATDDDGDRDWLAAIPIAADTGVLAVSAMADGPMGSTASGTASLHLGTIGVQLSDFDVAGPAATPELHWVRTGATRALWLSWVDQHDAALPRSLWLQRIDGAGTLAGTPTRVALSDTEDTLYARVAWGATHVGVLFQRRGTPYANFFAIADPTDGSLSLDPVALDPIDGVGYVGGDLVFDGQAFVGVFRSNTPAGQTLSALRADEAITAAASLTGPSVVAMGGADGDPMGPFTPFGTISVIALESTYVASFARDRFDSLLATSIPKAQVVRFDRTLAPVAEEHAGVAASFFWQYPPHLFATEGGGVLIWPETDLTSSDPNPPAQLRLDVVRTDGTLDPAHGDGFGLLEPLPPEYRTEPTLDPAPGGGGTLLWTDDRSHHGDPTMGRIELYAARFGDPAEHLHDEVRVPHARFIEETAFPTVARAGTNTIAVWLDEREGGGILDPRPQVWLETIWY